MKIVHAVYSLEVGGAEVLVAQLSRRQREAGHNVTICAYSLLGTVGEELRAEGFDVHVLGEAHPLSTARQYFRLFRAWRPDVVHCHNYAPTLQAGISARLAGAGSIVITRHSLEAPPLPRATEIKFSFAAAFCDWIVGICDITAANLRLDPFAHTDKIVRVYNGAVALERTPAPPELNHEGFTLLFVGRVAVIKNLEVAIRAFALASARISQLNLWIVGDGPVLSRLEALAAELGVADRVRFFGQRMNTAAFFSAADAFIMSSVSEGLPMSLLQAMSLGLPAVLTDVGGMAEVLNISQSGLLSPVGNASAMADSIVQLAQIPDLCAEFSRRAIATYNAHFTLDQMYEGYLELYQRRRG